MLRLAGADGIRKKQSPLLAGALYGLLTKTVCTKALPL
jgi:hypothetical protein